MKVINVREYLEKQFQSSVIWQIMGETNLYNCLEIPTDITHT